LTAVLTSSQPFHLEGRRETKSKGVQFSFPTSGLSVLLLTMRDDLASAAENARGLVLLLLVGELPREMVPLWKVSKGRKRGSWVAIARGGRVEWAEWEGRGGHVVGGEGDERRRDTREGEELSDLSRPSSKGGSSSALRS